MELADEVRKREHFGSGWVGREILERCEEEATGLAAVENLLKRCCDVGGKVTAIEGRFSQTLWGEYVMIEQVPKASKERAHRSERHALLLQWVGVAREQ